MAASQITKSHSNSPQDFENLLQEILKSRNTKTMPHYILKLTYICSYN